MRRGTGEMRLYIIYRLGLCRAVEEVTTTLVLSTPLADYTHHVDERTAKNQEREPWGTKTKLRRRRKIDKELEGAAVRQVEDVF